MKLKIFKIAYIALFLGILATFGIRSLNQKKTAIGNESVKTMEGATYTTFSKKFDEYFGANFGYRSELVDLNNKLKYNMFGQSGSDRVIAGTDGWLYFGSALHDYQGVDMMTDEEIDLVADKIKKLNDYITGLGKKFVFVCAPNKMEVYGENMPYYMGEDTNPGNYERLFLALADKNVDYVDLKAVLAEAKETAVVPLYHKLDSHWNNIGAAVAYKNIMDKLGIESTDYTDIPYSQRQDFNGDLYGMLFPKGKLKDNQYYYDIADNFYYTTNYRSNEDIIIGTANDEAEGSVLVFRDSFGNALYSFFARDFQNAFFTRALPYDVSEIDNYDVVVVEIVERNLRNLLDNIQ